MKYLIILSALFISFNPLHAQNAPIDFEAGGNGADWTWTVFENGDNPPVNIIANPDPTGANTSATVAEFTALAAGEAYAGCESLHGADIGTFTLDASTSLIKIMVWKSTISDVGIRLVENSGAGLPEIKVANTLVNQWEELTFNFSSRQGIAYDQIVVFPDFTAGARLQDNVVYFDNITFNLNENLNGCTDPTAANYNPAADDDDGSCLYTMTFNVDMNCYDPNDANIETEAPYAGAGIPGISGPFCGFCGDIFMTDDDQDGIWTISLDLPEGLFEYKYIVDGFEGQENLINDMVDGASCAPITDFFAYANRQEPVSAGGILNDSYGTCGVCNPDPTIGCTDPDAENYSTEAITDDGSCFYAVTFMVDMNNVTEGFTTPELNGEFNDFCGNCNPMSDLNLDGIWETTINLTADEYSFKFSADTWNIEEMLDESYCTLTTDGFVNRVINVPGTLLYGPVAWAECPPCPGDITGDGLVNIDDFLEFNSAFGTTCTGCPADLDGSGTVDINDFLILNSNFGNDCNLLGIQAEGPDERSYLNSALEDELGIQGELILHEELRKEVDRMRSKSADASRLYMSDGLSFTLRTKDLKGEEVLISILDMNGKSLYSVELQINDTQTEQRISFDTLLSSGFYMIAQQTSGALHVDRLLVE